MPEKKKEIELFVLNEELLQKLEEQKKLVKVSILSEKSLENEFDDEVEAPNTQKINLDSN